MTPKERAAMQQALEALEACAEKFYAMKSTGVIGALPMQAVKAAQAITALREALAKQAEGAIVKTCPDGYGTITTEQAEQEPVAWGQTDEVGAIVRCVPYATTQYDKYKSMGFVVPLYAAPVPITTPDVCGEVCVRAKLCYGCNKNFEEANAKYAEQAEQEPVAIDWEPLQNFWRNNSGVDWEELESAVKCAVAPPVRTKDLTDEEIESVVANLGFAQLSPIEVSRAVIAADREKNKCQ